MSPVLKQDSLCGVWSWYRSPKDGVLIRLHNNLGPMPARVYNHTVRKAGEVMCCKLSGCRCDRYPASASLGWGEKILIVFLDGHGVEYNSCDVKVYHEVSTLKVVTRGKVTHYPWAGIRSLTQEAK